MTKFITENSGDANDQRKTSSSSFGDSNNNSQKKKQPRKRRDDHNEIEKQRREYQRQQMEYLGTMIPKLANGRPSAIQIIIGSQEYIRALTSRVVELETYIAQSGLNLPESYSRRRSRVNSQSYQAKTLSPISPAPPTSTSMQFVSVPNEPHTMNSDTIISMFSNQNLIQSSHSNQRQPLDRQAMALSPTPTYNPEYIPHFNTYHGIPFTSATPNFQQQLDKESQKLTSQLMNSSSKFSDATALGVSRENTTSELISKDHTGSVSSLLNLPSQNLNAINTNGSRRDSAMLLPTVDPNRFLFGRRDSLHTLLSGPLPVFFQQGSDSEVTCLKCHRGVDNLIMIDCDICHQWFHIRCVSISPEQIPLNWSCPQCSTKSTYDLNVSSPNFSTYFEVK